MKKTVVALLTVVLICSLGMTATAEDTTARLATDVDQLQDTNPELKTFIKEQLIPLCTNEVFVTTVTEQNDQGLSLDDIKATDTAWIEAEDELPIHVELTGNDCAGEINKITAAIPAIGETFVMDYQGANVGQNELTSDYWQGDEDKFTDAYCDGQGGVYVSTPKLDKSTGQVDLKVSLPIVNGEGKVIGAVCFGINPDKL